MTIVTVHGQMGSGAQDIAKHVAKSIGAEYVDREIIAHVAERVRRDTKEVLSKEMPPGSFLGRIWDAVSGSASRGAGYQTIYLETWEMPLEDAPYIKALKNTITLLAQMPSIVILGRGSQFILRDMPNAFHVYFVAPLDTRVERVASGLNGDRRRARKEIERFDSSIQRFARHYFNAEIGDPINYDLVINTGRISLEAAEDILINAIKSRNLTPQ